MRYFTSIHANIMTVIIEKMLNTGMYENMHIHTYVRMYIRTYVYTYVGKLNHNLTLYVYIRHNYLHNYTYS